MTSFPEGRTSSTMPMRASSSIVLTSMERFEVRGAYRYGPKGAQFDSPDVLIKDQGKLVIVAECKATKLTYLAQFAEDPFETATRFGEELDDEEDAA